MRLPEEDLEDRADMDHAISQMADAETYARYAASAIATLFSVTPDDQARLINAARRLEGIGHALVRLSETLLLRSETDP